MYSTHSVAAVSPQVTVLLESSPRVMLSGRA
jgi:hypothetical protein